MTAAAIRPADHSADHSADDRADHSADDRAAHGADDRGAHRADPVEDRFAWLEDETGPRTVDWLAGQRHHTEQTLSALTGRDTLNRLLRSVIVGPTASPVKDAGTRRFRVGRDRPTDRWGLQVAEGAGPWRSAVDLARIGPGTTVRRWTPSPAGRLLAMQVSRGGSERATPLWLVEPDTGELHEVTALTRYSCLVWTDDEQGFFYVRRHLGSPGAGVYHHRVGTDIAADELVVGDEDPVSRYNAALWHDRWLVVGRRTGTGRVATLWSVDRHRRTETPDLQPIELDGSAVSSIVITSSGRAVAVSTSDAEFGRLVYADPGPDGAWRTFHTLVAERRPQVCSGIALVGARGAERLVVLSSIDGRSRLDLHDPGTGALLRRLDLPGDGTVSSVSVSAPPPTPAAAGPEDPGRLTISYTDWATPLSVWHVDTRTGAVAPVDPRDPALVDRPPISVWHGTYPSFDGTDVPITVLSPTGSSTGPRPTVLTCYGGFGTTCRPTFQPDGLAWVLAGGALAVAAVRGGGERGREWHRAGAGREKLTAVRDAQAAADWLVDSGATVPQQLALLGGSNGGMVSAAAAVRAPRTFAALAVIGAPLDMLGYERWGLGPAWRDEYGSAADPLFREALLSYSPYHNVDPARGRFPASLLAAGTDDSRVDPVHARKMTALLQADVTGGPVLLRMVDGGGHAGGGDVDGMVLDLLTFLAHHTGLDLTAIDGAEPDPALRSA